MKKLFSLLFMVFLAITTNAQTSIGDYVIFPDNKTTGKMFKPQLAIGKSEGKYLMFLAYTDKEDYARFDDESVILLKVSDDTTIKLSRCSEIPVQQDFDTSYLPMLGVTVKFYDTYTAFNLDEEAVNRILINGELIKKVRVSFTNGDIKDWDISEKYQKKLSQGLINSYNQVESSDAVRKEKIKDVEAGF